MPKLVLQALELTIACCDSHLWCAPIELRAAVPPILRCARLHEEALTLGTEALNFRHYVMR